MVDPAGKEVVVPLEGFAVQPEEERDVGWRVDGERYLRFVELFPGLLVDAAPSIVSSSGIREERGEELTLRVWQSWLLGPFRSG